MASGLSGQWLMTSGLSCLPVAYPFAYSVATHFAWVFPVANSFVLFLNTQKEMANCQWLMVYGQWLILFASGLSCLPVAYPVAYPVANHFAWVFPVANSFVVVSN
jgi:hypothetical protein